MRLPAGQDPGAGTEVGHIAPSQSLGPEGDFISCSREGTNSHSSNRLSPGNNVKNAHIMAVININSTSHEIFQETWREPTLSRLGDGREVCNLCLGAIQRDSEVAPRTPGEPSRA